MDQDLAPKSDIRRDIRKISRTELETFLAGQGQPRYRAAQVHDWVWKHGAHDFTQMNNLPAALRQVLEEAFEFRHIEVATEQLSRDGTVKSSFRLHDGNLIEGVLIPAGERMTACVSSQVGCSLSCKFCATGYLERMRNLEPGEIVDQVRAIATQAEARYGRPLTNIVFMGMGEPLLNYANVSAAIDRITSPAGMGMAARRITLSTAGIAKMIHRLGDEKVRYRLALSLHAADDAKRSQIMPINETNTLEALGAALEHYYQQTGNRVTFEYITFKNFNDSIEDAAKLVAFARRVPSKVNIIEYNPIAQAHFVKSDVDRLDRFAAYLEQHGIGVTVRRSRGKDIDAACGQLAGRDQPASSC